MRRLTPLLTSAAVAFSAHAAGIPTTQPLAYSGVLLDSTGAPVRTQQAIALTLWDDPVANGSPNKRCDTPSVQVTPDASGRFQVPLDQTCLDAVRANANLWVQVQVSAVILPRTKLNAVPYAVEAERATTLGASAQQGLVPTGTVVPFAGVTAPAGWVLCDGQSLSQTSPANAALFAVIGTRYGTGTGAGQFSVPDLRGRAVFGAGTGTGLSARNLASTFGAETLSLADLPSHGHPGTTGLGRVGDAAGFRVVNQAGTSYQGSHATGYNGSLGYTQLSNGAVDFPGANHVHDFTTGLVGGSAAGSRIPPALALNYLIRL